MATKKDLKALSQERFSRFAQGYVTSKVHAQGEELDRLVEIAQPQADWFMLDVATGGGHTALKFAPLVAQVMATDITPKMLAVAQEFLTGQGVKNVIFKLADAENLSFEAEMFDLVTCRIAPHHFTDCSRFVQESARVLKSGGLLLVQDHVSPEDEQCAQYVNVFQKRRDASHNQSYSALAWIFMFQAAGLKVEQTEPIVKRNDFLPWAERQGCTPEVIQQLVSMVEEAPPSVVEWMQPQDFGTPKATFCDHHIIIAGRKL
ncbi:class I SAM-dependent methyltransferase [Candidatus Poribacteria bacterium]|nr:class I SAM-dependent methyltransferase [Candidatus Poribacteria bacterium]